MTTRFNWRHDGKWLIALLFVALAFCVTWAQDTTLLPPTHAGAIPAKLYGIIGALVAVLGIIWRGLGSANWRELFTSGSWWFGLVVAFNAFMLLIGHPLATEIQSAVAAIAPVLMALFLRQHMSLLRFAADDKPGPTAYV
jgi:hypothetical protein